MIERLRKDRLQPEVHSPIGESVSEHELFLIEAGLTCTNESDPTTGSCLACSRKGPQLMQELVSPVAEGVPGKVASSAVGSGFTCSRM